jgi:hypothetical protein
MRTKISLAKEFPNNLQLAWKSSTTWTDPMK